MLKEKLFALSNVFVRDNKINTNKAKRGTEKIWTPEDAKRIHDKNVLNFYLEKYFNGTL